MPASVWPSAAPQYRGRYRVEESARTLIADYLGVPTALAVDGAALADLGADALEEIGEGHDGAKAVP
jgi:hypothetical protein